MSGRRSGFGGRRLAGPADGGGWAGEAPPLADDFWRVAHDEVTGRRLVDAGVVSLGLAAALLGELWLAGLVHIDRGLLYVIPDGPVPVDGLARGVLGQLAAERSDRSLVSWLAWLRTGAYEAVAQRMTAAGRLRPARWAGRRGWVATDALAAAGPGVVLRVKLAEGRMLDQGEVCLGGLVSGCGLTEAFLSAVWQPEPVRARLGWWLSHPGLHPGLADLLTHTGAAVTRAAMTAR